MPEMTIQQAMEVAKRHHQARQLTEAAGIYEQVLAAAPGHVEAMHLLGLAAMDLGRADAAVDLFTRAIAIQPDSGPLHYNLGVARMLLGKPGDAIEPYRRAIALQPDFLLAHGNLAVALISLGQFDAAILAANTALVLNPNHTDSLNSLGVAYKETARPEDALVPLRKAVQVDPTFAEAWINLASALQLLNRPPEAIAAYRQAIKLRPMQADLHHGLARMLAEDQQLEAARQAFESAILLRADYPEAHTNLANLLHAMGRFDEAVKVARKAVELNPAGALPKYNLALMLLMCGEYDEGWRLHEARFDAPQLQLSRHTFGRSVWNGEDLSGKIILLHSEQGSGDSIQCVRYIPMVRQRGGRIVLGCHPDLSRLFGRIDGIDRVVSDVDASLKFDLSCTLFSLPMIFGTNEASIPSQVPYLSAYPDEVARWAERLPARNGTRRIGLVWAGRPGFSGDRVRSMTLSHYAPLAQVPNATFISLQKGDPAAQLQSPPSGLKVFSFTDDLTDFSATAALMENLDLIITTDTSVAHLAGALGKPTWVLLSYVPDWRWLRDRDDSPWYPTMRLFRQAKAGDWAGVIERISAALNAF